MLRWKAKWDRFARHWYDLVQLDRHGHVDRALEDRELANAVAEHKATFFRETVKGTGEVIDYGQAVSGKLRLVPDGEILEALRDDYSRMVQGALFLDPSEPFDTIIEGCRRIEARANAATQVPIK